MSFVLTLEWHEPLRSNLIKISHIEAYNAIYRHIDILSAY